MGPGLIAVVAALGLLLAVRLAFVRRFPATVGRTTYGHRWHVADIRAAGHRLPVRPSAVLTAGAYTKPFLVHWLASFLPDRSFPTLNRSFPILTGVGFVALVGAVLSTAAVPWPAQAVALAAVVVTPQLVRPDRRANRGFATWPVGHLVGAAALVVLASGVEGGSPVPLVGAAVLGGLVHLTDLTAIQTWGLASLGYVVVEPVTALVVVATVLVTVAASDGRGFRVLFAYAWSIWRQLEGIYRHFGASPRPDVTPRSGLAPVLRSDAAMAILANPFVVAGLATVALSGDPLGVGPLPGLGAWLVAGVVGFAAALAPGLAFLADPDEFLEFLLVPSALLVGHGWTTFGAGYRTFVGLTVVLALVGLALCYLGFRPADDGDDAAWEELVDRLSALDRGSVVLHPADRSRELAWETGHAVVDTLRNDEASISQTNDVYPDEFLSVTDDHKMMRYYFNPTWAVFDKAATDRPRDRPDGGPLYENDRYAVFEFGDLVEDRWEGSA